MPRRYSAVLFDMDGTVLDSYEANAGTAQIIMERFGLPVPEHIPMRKFIGPPLEQSFGRWYHWKDEDSLDRVITAFRALYEERKFLCRVYPGIPKLLERLRAAGIRTSLATLKRQPYAEVLMEHFGVADFLDLVQGREPDSGIRDKADIIRAAMEKLGVCDPRDVVLVGDSMLDLHGAQAAGVDFVAVYYGFGFSRDCGDGPDPALCAACVDTVEELGRFLLDGSGD